MSTDIAIRPNDVLSGDVFTNPAMYDHVKSLAGTLAHGAFTPKHLIAANNPQRTLATCLRVTIQALRWGMDPFAVADETYEVHGRLGYQGKLIIGVVNARANLSRRLSFSYKGSGDNRAVTVSGQFADEDDPRTIELTVGQAKTGNEMWKKDPDQKLAYSGAIKWARRHCPELVLGVKTIEDLEAMPVAEQPRPRTLAEMKAEMLPAIEQDTPPPLPEIDEAVKAYWSAELAKMTTAADIDAAEADWSERAADDNERTVLRAMCDQRRGEL